MELGKASLTKVFECLDRKKVTEKMYDERHNLLASALRLANHHIIIGGINTILIKNVFVFMDGNASVIIKIN